mmetsp:Transcript_76043/g.202003  ORF Transcript_76043/g.202003 Transcript_76043/m.202003 type:complete len:215 (+) Transcript_76043:414-1058(+)
MQVLSPAHVMAARPLGASAGHIRSDVMKSACGSDLCSRDSVRESSTNSSPSLVPTATNAPSAASASAVSGLDATLVYASQLPPLSSHRTTQPGPPTWLSAPKSSGDAPPTGASPTAMQRHCAPLVRRLAFSLCQKKLGCATVDGSPASTPSSPSAHARHLESGAAVHSHTPSALNAQPLISLPCTLRRQRGDQRPLSASRPKRKRPPSSMPTAS